MVHEITSWLCDELIEASELPTEIQVTQWLVDEGYDTWLDVCLI